MERTTFSQANVPSCTKWAANCPKNSESKIPNSFEKGADLVQYTFCSSETDHKYFSVIFVCTVLGVYPLSPCSGICWTRCLATGGERGTFFLHIEIYFRRRGRGRGRLFFPDHVRLYQMLYILCGLRSQWKVPENYAFCSCTKKVVTLRKWRTASACSLSSVLLAATALFIRH